MTARSGWIHAFALAAIVGLTGCAAHVLPTALTETDRIEAARKLIEQRRFLDATEYAKSALAASTGSARVDEMIYLLGAAYLGQKEYPLAQGEFERLVRDYSESDSAGAASFRLGEALEGQSRPRDFDQEFTRRAIAQWESYRRGYPGHWLNTEADRRILDGRGKLARKLVDAGDLYRRLKLWKPAIATYERAVQEFGETIPSADAEVGIAMCFAGEGRHPEAIAKLLELEQRFPGRPVAQRAATQRQRLQKKH
ncbi:MAG: outer membrane protein assembly factor BamD [Candidatus Eisenbacteria bacterium]|uniref:Outer membrane protein assembly factor BamD n=1 Tax=Eiseniibacteriota bacterium TaxID=2212470 RepID=A0A849STZ2_UNCEI|nr:outer membrane protein assembly factor BamD [Candidatus Eisenbacteria bacterium]